jgi:hypothetical protein
MSSGKGTYHSVHRRSLLRDKRNEHAKVSFEKPTGAHMILNTQNQPIPKHRHANMKNLGQLLQKPGLAR